MKDKIANGPFGVPLGENLTTLTVKVCLSKVAKYSTFGFPYAMSEKVPLEDACGALSPSFALLDPFVAFVDGGSCGFGIASHIFVCEAVNEDNVSAPRNRTRSACFP